MIRHTDPASRIVRRSRGRSPRIEVGRLGMLRAAARAVLTLLILSSCARGDPRPEDELSAFLGHIHAGRAEEAWAGLSTASQRDLTNRYARNDRGEPVERTPKEILFEDLRLVVLGIPESVVLVSPFGSEVTLRASMSEGRSAEFRLVRDGKRWKVDLLSALRPTGDVQGASPAEQPQAPK